MEKPKYEYHVLIWGGFFNDEYAKIHNIKEGDYWFNNESERDKFIRELKLIETKLSAKHLMISKSEGYHCRTRTELHRIIKFKNKEYYSKYDMGVNYPYDAAMYHLEWKWYPGFNDYPLGEDFDYNTNEIKVIQEWITGAFDFKNE